MFVAEFTSYDVPLRVAVYSADWELVRLIAANAGVAKRAAEIPGRADIAIPGPAGVVFRGWQVRPRGFDGSTRHPVMVSQYCGPLPPWRATGGLRKWDVSWLNALVELGFVVIGIHSRGSCGRGKKWRQAGYRRLGQPETEDLVAIGQWIAAQPWAEPRALGIVGASYGGFMVLNVMCNSAVFGFGISESPVTSWRFYDTIYTEALLGLLEENGDAYDWGPLTHAERLSGRLLVLHGDSDDNVHVQNTHEFARIVFAAGKDVEVEVYPNVDHHLSSGFAGHISRRCLRFACDSVALLTETVGDPALG